MENIIICNKNCSLVVNINLCWLKLIQMQICKYFPDPNYLVYSSSSCYIFNFSCALSNNVLLSWTPREHSWLKAKTIVCSTFYIIHKSCPITIRIAMKHKFLKKIKFYTIVHTTLDISYNSFWQLENVIHYHNVVVRYIKHSIKLLYWPASTLSASSSLLNFSFWFKGVLVLFHFSMWNFFSISLAYFFWHIKIPSWLCFTSIPRKYDNKPRYVISNTLSISALNSFISFSSFLSISKSST